MSYVMAADTGQLRLEGNIAALRKLARIEQLFDPAGAPARGPGIQVLVGDDEFRLHLEGIIDLDAEKLRLSKAIAAAEAERDSLKKRLANPAFAERAKPEAVEKARADHDARAAEAERLSAALARLG